MNNTYNSEENLLEKAQLAEEANAYDDVKKMYDELIEDYKEDLEYNVILEWTLDNFILKSKKILSKIWLKDEFSNEDFQNKEKREEIFSIIEKKINDLLLKQIADIEWVLFWEDKKTISENSEILEKEKALENILTEIISVKENSKWNEKFFKEKILQISEKIFSVEEKISLSDLDSKEKIEEVFVKILEKIQSLILWFINWWNDLINEKENDISILNKIKESLSDEIKLLNSENFDSEKSKENLEIINSNLIKKSQRLIVDLSISEFEKDLLKKSFDEIFSEKKSLESFISDLESEIVNIENILFEVSSLAKFIRKQKDLISKELEKSKSEIKKLKEENRIVQNNSDSIKKSLIWVVNSQFSKINTLEFENWWLNEMVSELKYIIEKNEELNIDEKNAIEEIIDFYENEIQKWELNLEELNSKFKQENWELIEKNKNLEWIISWLFVNIFDLQDINSELRNIINNNKELTEKEKKATEELIERFLFEIFTLEWEVLKEKYDRNQKGLLLNFLEEKISNLSSDFSSLEKNFTKIIEEFLEKKEEEKNKIIELANENLKLEFDKQKADWNNEKLLKENEFISDQNYLLSWENAILSEENQVISGENNELKGKIEWFDKNQEKLSSYIKEETENALDWIEELLKI